MKVSKHVVLNPKVMEREVYKLLRRLQKDHDNDSDYTKIVTRFIILVSEGNTLIRLQEFVHQYFEEKK